MDRSPIHIIHCADIHLGFHAYTKNDKDDVNVRAKDIESQFRKLVDYAISEKIRAIMICGDLFDKLQPVNRVISFCMSQMLRLQQAKIKVFIVGGNHDTPKTAGVSSPLEMLSFFDNVICAWKDYTYHDFNALPDSATQGETIRLHLIPYSLTKKDFSNHISQAVKMVDRKEEKIHIVMLHGAYQKCKMTREEYTIDDEMKNLEKFDYIAMGHFHGQSKLTQVQNAFTGKLDYWPFKLESFEPPVIYPGSLEKLTFNEREESKGWVVLDVYGWSSDSCIIARPVDSKPREMFDLPDIDCVESKDLTQTIYDAISKVDTTDKICRVRVENVSAMGYRSIDFRKLKKLTEPAFHFEFIFGIKEEKVNVAVQRTSFKAMLDEWRDYANKSGIDAKLMMVGNKYIERMGD